MSNEFIEEIREDVRKDELVRLWNKYGTWFISGTVFLFILVGSVIYWNFHQEQKRISKAQLYESALQLFTEGKQDEAIQKLQSPELQADKGYALLSLFLQAQHQQDNREIFQKIADNPQNEAIFRELANIIICMNEIDRERGGSAIQILQPMTKTDSPWRSLATELLGLALFKNNQKAQAQQVFKNLLQDESVSNGIRSRAQAFLEYLQND